LFDDMVELAPAARRQLLERLQGDDPALAREVAGLLASDAAAAGFLSAPIADAEPTLLAVEPDEPFGALAVGDRVGAWELVAPLGAGGMGEVWEVRRTGGEFEQRAALKLLKRGLDSEEMVRRF